MNKSIRATRLKNSETKRESERKQDEWRKRKKNRATENRSKRGTEDSRISRREKNERKLN